MLRKRSETTEHSLGMIHLSFTVSQWKHYSCQSTTGVWGTDWPPSGSWSPSSSKPWGCCSRLPAVPDVRRPGRHSHKHKNMGAPPLSVCLTFYSYLSTWSHRWPFSSLYSRDTQLSPRHGEGRISSGYSRDMESGWRTPILLGHTDLDLSGGWNSWARGSHAAAGEAMEEKGVI